MPTLKAGTPTRVSQQATHRPCSPLPKEAVSEPPPPMIELPTLRPPPLPMAQTSRYCSQGCHCHCHCIIHHMVVRSIVLPFAIAPPPCITSCTLPSHDSFVDHLCPPPSHVCSCSDAFYVMSGLGFGCCGCETVEADTVACSVL